MKRILKSLSVVCLLMVLVLPLALVGCAKNYTITIQIVNSDLNSGTVYLKDVNGTPVVGATAVESGEKFEYFVKPVDGYEIKEVLVDGEAQEGYNVNGAYFYLEKVNKNHTIKVSFVRKEFTVTFYYIGAGGANAVLRTVPVKYGDFIDLNTAEYGGVDNRLWFVKEGNKQVYVFNNSTDQEVSKDNLIGNIEGKESNHIFVYANMNVYCAENADTLRNTYGIIF